MIFYLLAVITTLAVAISLAHFGNTRGALLVAMIAPSILALSFCGPGGFLDQTPTGSEPPLTYVAIEYVIMGITVAGWLTVTSTIRRYARNHGPLT